MNSDEIRNRSVQTDLMHNSAYMLKSIACMDDEALGEISDIVIQIEQLADRMESRIGVRAPEGNPKPARNHRPKLTIV